MKIDLTSISAGRINVDLSTIIKQWDDRGLYGESETVLQ